MAKTYDISSGALNRMRRSELSQDEDWIHILLQRAQVGHVATRWEEQPFITPTTFWYDSGRHEIYFHSNISGRLRANSERHAQVCFEASQMGRLLPSNVALEFSVQYESVVAFGRIRLLQDEEEKGRALYGLIEKYFPGMQPGREYRPITESELKRTAVYAIAVDSWSGKRNWKERADQSDDWPALDDKWFE
ncbi:MAG: pyridoxamine 5'-phosphate oxidase family protein [Anaerolineales bacterium]